MTSSPARSVVVVANSAFSLHNFRSALLKQMVARGAKVSALAPDYDDNTRGIMRSLGVDPIGVFLDRTGTRLGREILSFLSMTRAIRRIRPDLVFCYFMKPIIYGTLAAWLTRVPRRFALVAGLGHVFTDDGSPPRLRRRILRYAILKMYSLAFRSCEKVVLQNTDDIEYFVSRGVLDAQKACLVGGSGVDLSAYSFCVPRTSPIVFLLIARLLREKGIVDYVDAARLIRREHGGCEFLLVGGLDSNPGALSKSEVEDWVKDGIITWAGQVDDVRPWIRRASVYVLPSYYREGVPRSTQEAMAMGRPVITTDATGCRDTVKDGFNGFVVPVQDPPALAKAMKAFIERPELIVKMGKASRRLAEEKFDVNDINFQLLRIMGLGR